MAKPLSLRLLYTANIAGDLALLPRLHTFLQRLRSAEPRPTLLLDLGGACSQAFWHCRETGGRSSLIVLDGMGYQAANVAQSLAPPIRDQLARQVAMGLVDEGRDWLYRAPPLSDPSLLATLRPHDESARLQIVLTAAADARVDANALYLPGLGAGQVGDAIVDLRGEPALVSARIHRLPPGTPPNPSIAALVEFVEAEARYFAKQGR